MACNKIQSRLRAGILSIHPAPYRDYIFQTINQRGFLDCEVLLYFDKDHGHTEWEWKRPPYLSKSLSSSMPLLNRKSLLLNTLRALVKAHYDVIVIPGYSRIASLIAISYAICSSTPFVLSLDRFLEHQNLVSKRTIVKEYIVEYVIGRAASYWVPGSATRKYLRSFGIPDERIYEGAYCFDAVGLRAAVETVRSDTQIFRQELNIPDNAFLFLSVAKMTEPRRFKWLVETFGKLSNSVPAYLLLVGDGPEKPSIVGLCKDPKYNRIRLMAPTPFGKLPLLYGASDAYIHTGAEKYSTATEYAAISGLPILASMEIGYVYDLIGRGVYPLLFEAGNSQNLLLNITHLALNPTGSKELGAKLQEIAIQRNVDWAASQLEMALLKALSGRTNEGRG